MRLHQRLRREQGRHTDDWLITYADTITLLLCLFVVILTIRTGDRSVPRHMAAPTENPPATTDIFAAQSPILPFVHAIVPAPDDNPSVIGGDAIEAPTTAPPPRVALADAPPASEAPALKAPATMPETARTPPPAVEDHLKIRGTDVVEQRGERITTLQINSAAFFSSGYAIISGAGSAILRDVAVTLKSSEFAAYHISIEGHTDDTPISTGQFQSNWELSTARAAAVVRFLLEQGLSPRKLSAAGYADTFPIAPNRNADGTVIPENQARNRRVMIKLEKIDKAER